MKVQLTLNDELIERIDRFNESHYMTRTGFVTMACVQYLAQQEMFELLKDMRKCVNAIKDNKELTQEQLDELQGFAELLDGLGLTQ